MRERKHLERNFAAGDEQTDSEAVHQIVENDMHPGLPRKTAEYHGPNYEFVAVKKPNFCVCRSAGPVCLVLAVRVRTRRA